MSKVTIIAEAGVNHNGNIDIAKEMVDVAAEAKVDYIKFQAFIPKELVARSAEKAEYQKVATANNETQQEMLEKIKLDATSHRKLLEYCNTKNIGFLTTPFDLASIDMLVALGITTIKIPSGEINNLPYLRKIGRLNYKIFCSTGMSNIIEIKQALNILQESGTQKDNITLLHCNTEYPTPFEDVNLNCMHSLSKLTGLNVGYSDHTLGIEVPIAAVALGASVIEKHFTLDRSMEGPDQAASLEPNELKQMVQSIRNIELALGSFEKKVTQSELKNLTIARKSITAKTTILRGEYFTEDNICTKRPGNGISPMLWDEIIGKKSEKNYYEDEQIII
jgi:N,N'-diacetyllegionaminate synthase